VSSAIVLVEVHLAAARRAPSPARIRMILASPTLIPVDQPALEQSN
jgi:hypothetical protein